MLALVLALFGLLTAAVPAQAHDKLIGTEPGEQKVLDEAPTEVKLQFNNAILEVGTLIEVHNSNGDLVSTGDPVFNRDVVSQPLEADIPEDAYAVTWRVVSSDGHPISGEFAFAIGEAGAAALDSLEVNGSEESEEHDHDHDHADADTNADADSTDAADATAEQNNDTQKIVWGSVIAVVGVAVVIAVMVWFTRSSKKSAQRNS